MADQARFPEGRRRQEEVVNASARYPDFNRCVRGAGRRVIHAGPLGRENALGWASGVSLFDEVMDVVLPQIPEASRSEVVKHVADKFKDYDADTWDESKYFDEYSQVMHDV
jgi:hypothetical protein